MNLRTLELKDAPLMLEWMHDLSVVEFLQTDFTSMTLEDCILFIKKSKMPSKDFHRAVVDENDVYMGTVSLKNIHNGTAEFAITVRKTAMGQGYSQYGMERILRIGWEELRLDFIYWCVAPKNRRAVRFYDKHGYSRFCVSPSGAVQGNACVFIEGYSEAQIEKYIWYKAEKNSR